MRKNKYFWESRPFNNGKAFLGGRKNKHMNQNCGHKKVLLKPMKTLRKTDFALTHQKRFQTVITIYTQNKEKTSKKKKDKRSAHPQTRFSASENSVVEGRNHPWEQSDDNDNDNDNDNDTFKIKSSHEVQPCPTDLNGEAVASSKNSIKSARSCA